MFKFNFSDVNNENIENGENIQKEVIKWQNSEEIKINTQLENLDEIAVHAKMFICDDIEIGHVVPSEALTSMVQINNTIKAENQHSDLIPGEYEGGLKVWECTSDIIGYLIKHKNYIHLEKANVLDLGCGAGLIGIYAFMRDASVTFQDYNKEVIECVTIPNVLLNIEDEEERSKQINKCKFYCGDWASFNNVLEIDLFDFIFTSETIYNHSNYNKLIDLFSRRLSEKGEVYVAAKTYYFGVGGGTRQFETSLEKSKLFKSEVIWKSTGGIQREILKITRISKQK